MEHAPRHVVVFGELSPEQKRKYSKFIIDHNVKFAKNADGLFVATVRLERPIAPAIVAPLPKHMSLQERLRNIHVVTVPEALGRYTALCSMLETSPEMDAAKQPLSDVNLIKLLHEVYDAREAEPQGDVDQPSFCAFLLHFFQTRYGLPSLVHQHIFELLFSLYAHRDDLEAELFSSFLDGTYDDDALRFFLDARSKLVAMTTRDTLGTKLNVAKDSVWMSKAQCFVLAHHVYGARLGAPYLAFMNKMKEYVAGQPMPRSVHETMEMNEFLSLALETHQLLRANGTADYVPEIKENPPTSPADEKQRLFALLQRVRHRQDHALAVEADGWLPHQEHGQPYPPSPKSPTWK
ncbi:hypothetical protein SDRG_08528 [Saprolegnia diclina VS20]|uniref:Uncharacterized protein n=1 Tax=Saprolegnia diclina (strain VS20) TaxID=1156394 RepID=T0RTY3_SAPDV|nr:hypothetical protein SDRG_08528 [Saprolegnia diclina VS20]EQC33847.1 hypothetical protein SDRG_08528 [Saprolegnia diclina VS20]|eukprot:XP_008612642.1 hypothetical protein SDRG_08528 [Saprolegnia diclina VS20]